MHSSGLESVSNPAVSIFSNFFEMSFWICDEAPDAVQGDQLNLINIKDTYDSKTAR